MLNRETIGFWSEDSGEEYIEYKLYVLDGIFRMEKTDYLVIRIGGTETRCKRELGKRYFGDERFLIGVRSDLVTRIIREFNGKSEDEVMEIAKRYIDKREEHRTKELESLQKWERLRKKFGGLVIGTEKKVDVYENGFSVRVLFNSNMTFDDRMSFIKENKCAFMKWIMKEVSENKIAIRKIGDIRFYKPVEIINLRANEVEVKFEVKRNIEMDA